MATKVTPKAKPATETTTAKAKAPATTKIYLAVGRSFSHKGFKFLPNTIYEVPVALADVLLSVKASVDKDTFEEATRKQLGWPVVAAFTGETIQAVPGTTEIGGDLDAELMEHLQAGQEAGEPGAETDAGQDDDNDGETVTV